VDNFEDVPRKAKELHLASIARPSAGSQQTPRAMMTVAKLKTVYQPLFKAVSRSTSAFERVIRTQIPTHINPMP
jgi:hypothetical protein